MISPRARLAIAGTLAALVALAMGYGIAAESYALSLLLTGALAVLLLEWRQRGLPEAAALSFVLAGYVLGNRGFAQIMPAPGVPLLFAELALALAVPLVLARHTFDRTFPFRRDSLNLAVLLWLVIGALRIPWDVRTYGFNALRDFATIYYALFFFVGQSIADNPASLRLLRRTLLAVFAALPVFYFLNITFPDFFLQRLVFRGTPLFFYKEDLIASYLIASVFFLCTEPSVWRLLVAAASYGLAFSINSSRAAILGLLVLSGWWALARRWTPLRLQAALIPAGLVALLLVALVQEKPFVESRIYRLYEHVVSMVDVAGTRSYRHEDRTYVGDNNRFRLVWWRSVAEETLAEAPLLGLGFGADLSERFLRVYQLDLGEDFTTRSPHSIVFTMLGRLGLAGLATLAFLFVVLCLRTLRVARHVRAHPEDTSILGWWSVSWAIFTSGCFGVVLEGPMGAVLFWTSLGIANSTLPAPASPEEHTTNRAPRLPVGQPSHEVGASHP